MEMSQQHKFEMQKVFPLIKADEATHTVLGLVTAETPDKEGETCKYDGAKKAYMLWSTEAKTATENAGQEVSLGNIRVMHTDEMGGKATKIVYDDDDKSILIQSEPIDDDMWNLIAKGFITGYSQGGDYETRNCQDCSESVPKSKGNYCAKCKKVVGIDYVPIIAEVSYVDNPCHGNAHFQMVKKNGGTELVKFRKRSENMEVQQQPSLSEAEVQKIVKATIDEMKKSETPPVAGVKAKVKKADEKNGTGKSSKAKEAIKSFIEKKVAERVPDKVRKDLNTVARFAGLINEIAYVLWSAQYEAEMELDASTVPDELQEDLESLVETFLAMAEEESNELTAAMAEKIGKVMKVDSTGLEKAYNKAAGIVNKIKKAVTDHHEAMTTANKEHADKVKGHLEDLKDCMSNSGSKAAKAAFSKVIPKTKAPDQDTDSELDDQEEGELEEIDPSEEGTENIAQKSFSKSEVEEIVNKSVQSVISALSKKDDEEDDEEEEKPAKKAAKKKPAEEEEEEEEEPAKKVTKGIGNRSEQPTRGPQVKTTSVTKTQDSDPAGGNRMVKNEDDTTIDRKTVSAALQKGDVSAQLKLMKSAVPQNSVPSTLHGAVGKLGRGRR